MGQIIPNFVDSQHTLEKNLIYNLLPVQYTKLTHHLSKFLVHKFLAPGPPLHCAGEITGFFNYSHTQSGADTGIHLGGYEILKRENCTIKGHFLFKLSL